MQDLPEALWHESYRRRAFRRVQDGTPSARRGGAPSGVRRLEWDAPSKAITGGALRDFLHPLEDRPLTLRECARLQTFDDEFTFVGTRAERAQLIGNAVPPQLAESVGRHLFAQIDCAVSDERQSGALLSFVPTLSTGMSPALMATTSRVRSRFMARGKEVQSLLWH